MPKKDVKKKNYIDETFMSSLMGACDHAAGRYSTHGFQKQAKKARDLKKKIKPLLGGI